MGRRARNREPATAKIVSATHDGRGIADTDGKKVFVAGALPGEEVLFQRRKFRRNFDEAELLDVIEPSPDRIQPRCAVYSSCGGCSLQHVDSRQQRAIKEQALKDSFERIGRLAPTKWFEPMTGPEWEYRRRGRLAVKDVHAKGRVLVGFRERHAPFVTDMRRCEVLAPPVGALIEELSELVGQLSIRARLPQIEVSIADNAVALVFRVLDPPSAQDEELLATFGARHDLRIYLQPGGLDSVGLLHPDEDVEPLFYELPEFDVRIAFEPVGFVQINAEINRQMVHAAVDMLAPTESDRVLDLFCGIGNFSLPIARRAGAVLGVEMDDLLVRAAAANAAMNGIENASFRRADLSKIDGSEAWLNEPWDLVLLDPARSGAQEVVERIDVIQPKRLVYVSCHPGTLARDAGVLVNEKGYTCDGAGIIDMFPQTSHVESVAVFSK